MSHQDTPHTTPEGGFRTFVALWASQTLSVFGSQLTFFAMTVWLTTTLYPNPDQKGLLAAALSMVSLAFGLPNIVLAPFAGVLADRQDRKAIMLWTDVAAGLVSLALAVVLHFGILQLWSLITITTLFSILQCFHNSAFDASYAMIVPEDQLPRANGMMQTIFGLSGILSPALAAVLIGLPALLRDSPEPGFLARVIGGIPDGAVLAAAADTLTFFIAAAVLPFLRIPSPHRVATQRKPSLWGDVKEGMAFIGARRGLLWLLATFALSNFCSAPAGVLRPMIVRDNLASDYVRLGLSYEGLLALMGSAGAIGGVAGGFIITAWGGLKKKRVYGILVPLVLGGAAQLVFGLSRGVYLATSAVCVTMFTVPFANTHSQTIWQTQTPREMQGRVFAVRRVVAQFTSPLGTAVSGFLGSALDPGIAVAGCGLIAVASIAAQFLNKSLTAVEEDTALPGTYR